MKPANKAREAHRGGVCGGGRSGVGGAKGGGQGEYAPAKHVLDSEPGSRVTGAGAYTATCAVTHPRQEPYAGKPHVRICAGACDETHVPTATAPRVHHAPRRRGGRVAARGARSSRRVVGFRALASLMMPRYGITSGRACAIMATWWARTSPLNIALRRATSISCGGPRSSLPRCR